MSVPRPCEGSCYECNTLFVIRWACLRPPLELDLRRIRLGGSGESRGKISRKGGVACVAPPRPHVASRRWPESLRREKRGDPKSRTKRSLLSSHARLTARSGDERSRGPRAAAAATGEVARKPT